VGSRVGLGEMVKKKFPAPPVLEPPITRPVARAIEMSKPG